jgi:hypothetical protein
MRSGRHTSSSGDTARRAKRCVNALCARLRKNTVLWIWASRPHGSRHVTSNKLLVHSVPTNLGPRRWKASPYSPHRPRSCRRTGIRRTSGSPQQRSVVAVTLWHRVVRRSPASGVDHRTTHTAAITSSDRCWSLWTELSMPDLSCSDLPSPIDRCVIRCKELNRFAVGQRLRPWSFGDSTSRP